MQMYVRWQSGLGLEFFITNGLFDVKYILYIKQLTPGELAYKINNYSLYRKTRIYSYFLLYIHMFDIHDYSSNIINLHSILLQFLISDKIRKSISVVHGKDNTV